MLGFCHQRKTDPHERTRSFNYLHSIHVYTRSFYNSSMLRNVPPCFFVDVLKLSKSRNREKSVWFSLIFVIAGWFVFAWQKGPYPMFSLGIAWHRTVRIQRHGDSVKYIATVLHEAHEADLGSLSCCCMYHLEIVDMDDESNCKNSDTDIMDSLMWVHRAYLHHRYKRRYINR